MIIVTSIKIRSYNDQHSTRIPVIPIVVGLKSSAQMLRLQPLKPVLLIVANREKQLSLNSIDNYIGKTPELHNIE